MINRVDKFKMFTFELLRADVALAVSPDQIHLPANSQQTVTVPNGMLLERRGFGRAFELERVYDLPDMQVSQFRRVRDVTAEEVTELLAVFAKTYPAWPAAYQQTIGIPLAMRAVSKPARWGHGSLASPNTIVLHPDADGPTSVTIPFDPRMGAIPSAVELRLGAVNAPACGTADGVAISVSASGKKIWQGVLAPATSHRVPLPATPGAVVITVDKRGNEYCDQTYATFKIEEN